MHNTGARYKKGEWGPLKMPYPPGGIYQRISFGWRTRYKEKGGTVCFKKGKNKGKKEFKKGKINVK